MVNGARSSVFLSVVVPAFDEASRLLATIEDTSSYLARQSYTSEILVVDDGSSDATPQVARDQAGGPVPIRLVQHPDGRNHGKGAAVRRGILAASGAYRLFMDSDNSTTIDQFEGFLPLFEQNYDVVVGSRRVMGAKNTGLTDADASRRWLARQSARSSRCPAGDYGYAGRVQGLYGPLLRSSLSEALDRPMGVRYRDAGHRPASRFSSLRVTHRLGQFSRQQGQSRRLPVVPSRRMADTAKPTGRVI